jgi:hypothetical protein
MDTPVLVGIIVVSTLLGVFLLVSVARSGSGKNAKNARLCGQCNRAMLPAWDRCMFCGWQPVARLEFIHGPMAGQTVNLTEHVTTIGSVAGNNVVLADPAVSRKHAGIRRIEGNYELADFGSTNGVYVNGHKVPKKNLDTGDVVRVGNSEAVFKRE